MLNSAVVRPFKDRPSCAGDRRGGASCGRCIPPVSSPRPATRKPSPSHGTPRLAHARHSTLGRRHTLTTSDISRVSAGRGGVSGRPPAGACSWGARGDPGSPGWVRAGNSQGRYLSKDRKCRFASGVVYLPCLLWFGKKVRQKSPHVSWRRSSVPCPLYLGTPRTQAHNRLRRLVARPLRSPRSVRAPPSTTGLVHTTAH